VLRCFLQYCKTKFLSQQFHQTTFLTIAFKDVFTVITCNWLAKHSHDCHGPILLAVQGPGTMHGVRIRVDSSMEDNYQCGVSWRTWETEIMLAIVSIFVLPVGKGRASVAEQTMQQPLQLCQITVAHCSFALYATDVRTLHYRLLILRCWLRCQ